jgi:V-type H+-transporting ATPase subunit d
MAAPVAAISVLGGMSTFNMAHGFVEALVRGMRSSFLLDADYHHLTQCENLEVLLLSFVMTLYYCHPSL